MSAPNVLTAKGRRGADRVLEAATTVLSRDGYSRASLARIADEAGVDKRTVLYYYGTREALLVRVVQTVGERIAQHIDAAIDGPKTPFSLADTLVDVGWSAVTSAPELARAYFALIGAGNPLVEQALADLKAVFLDVVTHHLGNYEQANWQLRGELTEFAALTLAAFRGLLLEWTETGDTPTITANLSRCKVAITAQFDCR